MVSAIFIWLSVSVFYCLSRIIPDTCMFISVYLLMCILLLLYVFFVVQLLLVFFCRNVWFFILAHFSIYVVDTVYRPCFFSLNLGLNDLYFYWNAFIFIWKKEPNLLTKWPRYDWYTVQFVYTRILYKPNFK